MDKMELGYLTVYRGNVTDMKSDKTEIAIKRFHFLNNRWYLNPTDSSLDRVNRILQRYEPSILISEVLDDSVYITFRFRDNTNLNN